MKQIEAIELLIKQLKSNYNIDIERLSVTDKIKSIAMEQMKNAYHEGIQNWGSGQTFEQYYNQTFNK
jgi:hypothetical protein